MYIEDLLSYLLTYLLGPLSMLVFYDTVVVATPNCSFPYTYNGGLYYGCINDMTGVSTADQPFACMAVNATPSVCDSPGVQTS